MEQVKRSYIEASNGLGMSKIDTFLKITLLPIYRGLLVGGALVFLSTMKELLNTLFGQQVYQWQLTYGLMHLRIIYTSCTIFFYFIINKRSSDVYFKYKKFGLIMAFDNLIIRTRSVYKSYDKEVVLSDFNLDVWNGSIVGILGASGSGKTTALRLIAGFDTPDSGVIEMRNKVISSKDIFIPPEERNVGMVFQDYALFPHLTSKKILHLV